MAPGSTLRFRRRNRLLDAAQFGRVFKQATRSRDKLFTVLCRDNRSDTARLGLAISKRHCRKATARNRLKRLVRESFRAHTDELVGLDVVVMNKPEAGDADNRQVFDSLERHWRHCTRRARNRDQQDQ